MNTLVEIQKEYLALISEYEQCEELTPELEAAMEINQDDYEKKAIGYREFVYSEENDIKRIDARIKELQALKKRKQSNISFMKNMLLNAVKMFGEVTLDFKKIGTRKSAVVEVDDVNSLPKEFKNTKITETADKTAIKIAIKEGKEIEGCRIVEKLNLSI